MILLDTNVLSEAMRVEPDGRVMRWLDGHPPSVLFLSAVPGRRDRGRGSPRCSASPGNSRGFRPCRRSGNRLGSSERPRAAARREASRCPSASPRRRTATTRCPAATASAGRRTTTAGSA